MRQTKISAVVAIIAFFQICSCKLADQNVGKEYSFSDWNADINDSVKISYSLDTLFKVVPPIGSTWNDAKVHFPYGYDSVYILISYYWGDGKKILDSESEDFGKHKIIGLKDAGIKPIFENPKLCESGGLNGLYIMYKNKEEIGLKYWGQSKDYSCAFSIIITSLNNSTDIEKLLHKLLRTFKAERKTKKE